MHLLYISCGLLCCALLVVSSSAISSSQIEEFVHQQKWAQFKLRYNKEYADVDEEYSRYQIFKDSLARAERMNMQNPEATFGVTQFSDLTTEEFQARYLAYQPRNGAEYKRSIPVKTDAPNVCSNADVDWRDKGAITPVKDQGSCGSCWAFSAVEGVESAWYLKHGNLPVLSPQQVVSCDTKVDQGCDGGDLPPAFQYIQDHGLEGEATYPYKSGATGITGRCNYTASAVIANITGFTYATPPCTGGGCKNQDEATLLNNLASAGPSSICVNADPWQDYQSGVLSALCSGAWDALNHCVQLVGYKSASPKNYWIVRNSWGTDWGQKGYIYIAYGKNLCGLADEATLVTSA